jgi:hypothetical protein
VRESVIQLLLLQQIPEIMGRGFVFVVFFFFVSVLEVLVRDQLAPLDLGLRWCIMTGTYGTANCSSHGQETKARRGRQGQAGVP